MLKALREWVLDQEPGEAAKSSSRVPADRDQDVVLSEEDRRLSFRHDFCGHRVVIRDRRSLALLHLKDLSCMGASGITDLPVAVGEIVFLTLKKPRFHAAEVRRVKNAMIELRFFRFLDPQMVEKIHAAHLARKAAGRPLDDPMELF